ncbi:TPA: hypothetical protein ACNTG5_005193, partial [Escherichia coli]
WNQFPFNYARSNRTQFLDAVIQYLNENAFLGECFDSILNQVIFFLSAGWTLSPEGRVSTG